MAIVLITVFVFGCSSDLILSLLGIETGVDEQEFREITCKTTKYPLLKKLDQDFLCPFFIRDYKKTDGDNILNKGNHQLEQGIGNGAADHKEKLLQEVLHNALRRVYNEHDCEKIIGDLANNPQYPLRPRTAIHVHVRADSIDELYNDGRSRFSDPDGCVEGGIDNCYGHSHNVEIDSDADETATQTSFVA